MIKTDKAARELAAILARHVGHALQDGFSSSSSTPGGVNSGAAVSEGLAAALRSCSISSCRDCSFSRMVASAL